MTEQKYISELKTVGEFIQIYCDDRHKEFQKRCAPIKMIYKDIDIGVLDVSLCAECTELLKYANERLKRCPHEIKPRCRRCEQICYTKEKLKKITRVMIYSGSKVRLKRIFAPFLD